MFLHALDRTEQRAFATAAVHIVHADGTVDPRELVLLKALAEELHMSRMPDAAGAENMHAELSAVFDPAARRLILLELAGVSTSDGEIHTDEVRELTSIAAGWGIGKEFVLTCLDFAARAHAVWEEGRSLITQEAN